MIDPSTDLKLVTAINKYDERQAKMKYYNRYALPQYLAAIQKVREEVASGKTLARALYDNYNGRLLSALEKSVGLPLTYGGGGADKGRPA